METFTAPFVGLATALAATFFPGMLNMTAVATSLRVGRRAGYRFAQGLAITLLVQAGVAVLFAEYLGSHPGIIGGMKRYAVLIFVALAVFFFVKAWRGRHRPLADRPYHGSPFWRGVAMAIMNFLTLPYFFAVTGWLVASGYLSTVLAARLGFTLGVGAGALLVFGLYARSAAWIDRNAHYLTQNINYVLGGLFTLLAVVQGVRLLHP